jgi:hypothetical protein
MKLVACPRYGRRDESADRRRLSDRCEDRGAVARAIYADRTAGLVGDCLRPWAQAHLLGAQDQGDCSSHAVEQAGGDDALELSADGASPGREQTSVADLQSSIAAFLEAWNENPNPLVWTETVESIQAKLARCRQTLEQIKSGCTAPRTRKRKIKSPVISRTPH